MNSMWITQGPRDVVLLRFVTLSLALAGLAMTAIALVLYS